VSDPFRLDLVSEGATGRLYTFRDPAAEADDLTQFLDREDGTVCSPDERHQCHEDLDHKICPAPRCRRYEFRVRLLESLNVGVNGGGFLDHHFARKDRYPFPVGAIKAGRYRLYGVHYGPDLFIAGDGGLKLVPKIKDDPALLARFGRVTEAARRLDEAIRQHCGSHQALPRDTNGVRYLPDPLLSFD